MKTILCESCLREGKEIPAKVFIQLDGDYDDDDYGKTKRLIPVCTQNGLDCEVPLSKGRARWQRQIVREVQKS